MAATRQKEKTAQKLAEIVLELVTLLSQGNSVTMSCGFRVTERRLTLPAAKVRLLTG